MNGVDVADQLTVFYSFVRKTRKWWRKLFFLLYGGLHSKQLPLVQTDRYSASKPSRLQESSGGADSQALHAGSPPRPGPGAPRRAATHDLPQRLNGKPHFIGRSPKDRDCVVCSERGTSQRRHRTVYYCITCTNHPFLCPDTCFQRYHTLPNYKQPRI